MIDIKFTEKIQQWLNKKEHTDVEDILNGAMMLLQLNRNKAMYNTIVRNPRRYVNKIIYEMKKFLPIRLSGMTIADVKRMDEEITPIIKKAVEESSDNADDEDASLPTSVGKREDHNKLPEDIQNIWKENTERWKKIKEQYNTCLSLTEPCDRFEHLTILKDLWYKYKAEFEKYDTYEIQQNQSTNNKEEIDPAKLAKDINNARSYISNNIDKLVSLKKKSDSEKATEADVKNYNDLLEKVEKRTAVLSANKQVIGDELKDKLEKAGVKNIK